MKKRNRIGAGRIGSCRIGVIKNARIGGQAIEGGSGTTATPPLLDTYTGVTGVHTLRKALSAYTGNCIRVREVDGDTELNIGFSGNALDQASLLAHCGENNGFTVTSYDQAEKYDVTQSIASRQIQIVESGAVRTINGIHTYFGSGASQQVLLSGNYAAEDKTSNVYAVCVYKGSQTDVFAPLVTYISSRYLAAIDDASASTTLNSNAGTPVYRKNGSVISPSTRDDLHTQYCTGSPVLMAVSGADMSSWVNRNVLYDAAVTWATTEHMTDLIMLDAPSAETISALEAQIISDYGIS